MTSLPFFVAAAVLEIAGCYAVWMWLRLDRSWIWMVPGALLLLLFAVLLTRAEPAFAGRAYAAYGGVYLVSTLAWLSFVERTRPSATDLGGVLLCLAGSVVILLGGRVQS